MAGESKVTTDHDDIRRWVENRGGRPAKVKGTEQGDDPGVLRIDYPGFTGDDVLESISWEEFFKAFDDHQLAFLYQETTKDGKESRFSKFIRREDAKGAKHGASHS